MHNLVLTYFHVLMQDRSTFKFNAKMHLQQVVIVREVLFYADV